MKINIFTLLAVVSLFAVISHSCDAKYDEYTNGLYLAEAQSSPVAKVVVDDHGGVAYVTPRLSSAVSPNVKVTLGIDEEVLDRYNKRYGTNYNLLPAGYYEIETKEVMIEGGKVAAAPVKVIIKSLNDELDVSESYAIPVIIKSVSGGPKLMNDSKALVIAIDPIIVRAVPYLTGGNGVLYNFTEPKSFSKWTLEWLHCHKAYNRNNVTQWTIKNGAANNIIYTRFGDVTCPQDQFQYKIGESKANGVSKFTANTWYHMALVYDGNNLMLYVNGELDFVQPYYAPGEVFEFKEVCFANILNASYTYNGWCGELRVWSVPRTQMEIANNMYTVRGNTPGLEMYWKLNEGEGMLAKDHSGNNRNADFKNNPIWLQGVRFPQ